jgi:hypothetical protein
MLVDLAHLDNDGNRNSVPSLANLFNNDFDQSATGTFIQVPFTIDPSNLDNLDPLFVDAVNGDYHLQAGSPVINKGNNQALSLPPTDKDGYPRILPTGGTVDMGAFEFLSDELLLTVPMPGMPGIDNTVEVSGATPGATIFFGFGFLPGATPIAGCPRATVGILSPRLAGTNVADDDGQASLSAFVPTSANGRTVLLQVVEHSSCTVSNLVTYTFP